MLIVSNLMTAYWVIDTAISYTYLNDSFASEKESNDQLSEILVALGNEMTQKDFLITLRQLNPEALISQSPNTISMGKNSFHFQNNRFVGVQKN